MRQFRPHKAMLRDTASGLWTPVHKNGKATKFAPPVGRYKRVQKMQVVTAADHDRRVTATSVLFLNEGLYYEFDNAQQVRQMRDKLDEVYRLMTSRGQSAAVSLD